MTKRFLMAVTLLLAATFANAQGQLPPGKWWRMPQVVKQLQITAAQQTQLDTIFRGSASDLIDLKAAVDKASIALRGELDDTRINRTELQQAARRLNEARGRLFEREVMLLADMRAVLTDSQWTRLREELDQRQQQHQQQRRRRPAQ
ncbi:MAG TPA: periplasmic heavy metal sensor [Thermoanaerobaculia bacterium]